MQPFSACFVYFVKSEIKVAYLLIMICTLPTTRRAQAAPYGVIQSTHIGTSYVTITLMAPLSVVGWIFIPPQTRRRFATGSSTACRPSGRLATANLAWLAHTVDEH